MEFLKGLLTSQTFTYFSVLGFCHFSGCLSWSKYLMLRAAWRTLGITGPCNSKLMIYFLLVISTGK